MSQLGNTIINGKLKVNGLIEGTLGNVSSSGTITANLFSGNLNGYAVAANTMKITSGDTALNNTARKYYPVIAPTAGASVSMFIHDSYYYTHSNKTLYVGSINASTITGNSDITIGSTSLKNAFKSVSVSGATLTFTKFNGGTATATITASAISGTVSNASYAISAGTADVALALNVNSVGDVQTPVYFSNGNPVAFSVNRGTVSKPIYLSGGAITAMSSTYGSASRPVYMSAGAITPLSSTVGSTSKPVYMNGGTITPLSATVGNNYTPVYLSNGTITSAVSVAAQYVNVSLLTGANYYMLFGSSHNGNVVVGPITGMVTANTTAKAVYFPGYTLSATTFSGNLTGNAATATKATSLGTNAGSATLPVYFTGGKPVACSTTLATSITGNAATATQLTNFEAYANTPSKTPSECITNGIYYVSSDVNSLTDDNGNPFLQYHSGNADFRIFTTAYNSSWVQQIATDLRTEHIYSRRKDSGTWKPWRLLTFGQVFSGIKSGVSSEFLPYTGQSIGSPEYVMGFINNNHSNGAGYISLANLNNALPVNTSLQSAFKDVSIANNSITFTRFNGNTKVITVSGGTSDAANKVAVTKTNSNSKYYFALITTGSTSTNSPIYTPSAQLLSINPCTNTIVAPNVQITTSFTLSSGSIVGNTANSATNLGWTTTDKTTYRIPTINLIAYWNGAYSDQSSNLVYCSGGEIASKTYVTSYVTSKVPTSVGSVSKPTYTNASGVVTAMSNTYGSASKPIYMNAGNITAMSNTYGSASRPVYMSAGAITPLSSTVGDVATPVYLSNGTITKTTRVVSTDSTYDTGKTIAVLSSSQYAALSTKNSNTIYFVY